MTFGIREKSFHILPLSVWRLDERKYVNLFLGESLSRKKHHVASLNAISKKVFCSNLCVGCEFHLLEIPQYFCGLKFLSALFE